MDAASDLLAAGYGAACLVNADSPNLPTALLIEAAQALAPPGDRIVLGHAADGGYYLIGCRRTVPPVFDGIAWGGPRVLLDTVARLPERCRLALLPLWYDVDTLADWYALRGQLAAWRRAGIDPGVPHTERLPLTPEPRR